jgi:hypothetical protein
MALVKSRTVSAEPKPVVGADTLEFEQIEEDVSRIRAAKLSANARKLVDQLASRIKDLQHRLHVTLAIPDPHKAGESIVASLQNAEGGAYTAAELPQQWQLSTAVLHRRRTEFRIIYWRDAKHAFHYPRWQFNEAGALLPGIQEVLQMFKSRDEWRVMRYFLGARKQLDERRPLDLLRAGKIEAVLAHAQLHAAENTW